MVHIPHAYLYTTYHLLLYPCLWPHSTTGLIINRSYQQVNLPEIHNNRWKCNTNRWYTTSLLDLDGSHDHFIHEPVQELLSERIAGWVWFAMPTRRRQLQPFTTRQLHTEINKKKISLNVWGTIDTAIVQQTLQIHSKRKKTSQRKLFRLPM